MKAFKTLAVILISVLFFASAASASLERTDGPYMTDNDTVIPTASQIEFDFDETPFAFIQLTPVGLFKGNIAMTWTWEYAGTPFTSDTQTIFSPTSAVNLFHAYSGWETVKMDRYGEWKVTTNWVSSGGSGNLVNTFTLKDPIVPEPVSSALFLVGGLALASKRFLKKKKA